MAAATLSGAEMHLERIEVNYKPQMIRLGGLQPCP